jgi:hypothetical protein
VYLTSLPTILRTYTNGYGIWGYKNYANNPLYNCEFALGIQGWKTSHVRIVERDGSKTAALTSQSQLTQRIGSRMSGKATHDNHVSFTADSGENSSVQVTVALGNQKKTVTVSGKQEIDLNFGKGDFEQITFTTTGETYIDNVKIYNFVQNGELYDTDGTELSCIAALRTLNAQMN